MQRIKTDLSKLAKMFGLPDENDMYESAFDYIAEAGAGAYRDVYDEEIRNGSSEKVAEEKAEAAREKSEQLTQDEVFHQYHHGITSVADDLFGHHAMTLVPRRAGERYPFGFDIQPDRGKTWKDVAREIVKTIHGVGSFEFSSLEEFKSAGPYKDWFDAVKHHIGWITSYPEVYGTASPNRIYESAFR